jgi:hypothetical protein
MTTINSLSYKEVFQLAQDKGYEIYLPDIFSGQYSEGTIREGYSDLRIEAEVKEVENLCELTLIQKWLRDEHKIYFEIDTRLINGVITHRVCHSRLIAGMIRRITTFENESYELALLHGINGALKLIKSY